MKIVKEKQNIYSVTRDSGANVKILKRLQNAGLIKIYDVMLENGRENTRVKDKILPVLILSSDARLGEAVLGGEDSVYEDIRKIIGKKNVEDAMHLEVHIRHKHDYFATEDHHFLDVRDELNKKFDVKIVTPEKLEIICKN